MRSHASLHCGLTGAVCPFVVPFALFFDLSLLLRLEKNGIAAKQLRSRANVAFLIDHANVVELEILGARRAVVQLGR